MSAPPTEVSPFSVEGKKNPSESPRGIKNNNNKQQNSSLSKVNVHHACSLHAVPDYLGGCESLLSSKAVRLEKKKKKHKKNPSR